MKILKNKKCEVCNGKQSQSCHYDNYNNHYRNLRFEFNYFTCRYDCYWEYYVNNYKDWRRNNKCHRVDGPARIWRNCDGKIIFKEWHVNGVWMKEKGNLYEK